MVCVVLTAALLLWRPLPRMPLGSGAAATPGSWTRWLPALIPLLAVTLLATAMQALMQSALPLDLVRGGLERGALAESGSALLIGVQLGLLLLLQWPVGQAMAQRSVATGLGLSLLSYALGSLLLALSALSPQGVVLMLAAQLPLALGSAAFLPTATEAMVQLGPADQRGLAMAVFSQCFAITALTAPLLAGVLLDGQGHGAGLWLGMAVLSLAGLALLPRLKRAA
jgi:MFS family permease